MTAITQPRRTPRLLWFLPIVALFFGMALAAILNTPHGKVLTTPHAVERHGKEAIETRCQIRDNGALEQWQKDDDPCIFYWLTQLKCGRFAVLIAQVFPSITSGCEWRECSAFVIRDGCYKSAIDYLSKHGSRLP